jgi:hypothetical protein
MKVINISIYGDNILECERMFDLIYQGFAEIEMIQTDLSHIYSPIRTIKTKNTELKVQFYPDYKSKTRWHSEGLLHILIENGANLTEAPDVILTKREGKKESILLAIEFSSALPAGNQAWQRSGRALSFSEVNIPYLYINDIGLEELDSKRQSKAVRSSNPLVPLSYIKNTQRSSSFTLSVLNPSQLLLIDEEIKKFIVEDEVFKIINDLIFDKDISKDVDKLIKKTANYLNSFENIPENIDFKKWINIEDSDIEKFIKGFKLADYKKKIAKKTPIKDEMKMLISDVIPKHAVRIYNDLPICFVPSLERKKLKENILNHCYSGLSQEVINWLGDEKPLVICFINGFKPRGDDARPDRGLVPFARMLFGFEVDLLALVFGQAPKEMETLFKNNPITLAEKNGLWKSILYYSSLTIADSCHWGLTDSEKTKFLLKRERNIPKKIELNIPSRIPIKFNENDVDTAIHITFGKKEVFEGLCNPPGGDWSGISLIDSKNIEHRWMSLPRVSKYAKRPDHVLQIFHNKNNYLLVIESKEKLSGLLSDQDNLGNGLKKYVNDLIAYQSSAIRVEGNWERNNQKLNYIQNFKEKYSAVAFIISSDEEMNLASKNLKVDLIIGFDTNKKNLVSKPVNKKGKDLQKILFEIKIF